MSQAKKQGNLLLQEKQLMIERLSTEAIKAAVGGKLQHELLCEIVNGVRDAALSGARTGLTERRTGANTLACHGGGAR